MVSRAVPFVPLEFTSNTPSSLCCIRYCNNTTRNNSYIPITIVIAALTTFDSRIHVLVTRQTVSVANTKQRIAAAAFLILLFSHETASPGQPFKAAWRKLLALALFATMCPASQCPAHTGVAANCASRSTAAVAATFLLNRFLRKR
ncbi:hypothetical protein PUN28_007443 [Cardiocondyla obscurior]|uniref:Secreted protein n=1 Tax=Cardiocondyla obscurior TaxID=286306 RepID=A0AAW2G6A9_9HYME